MQKNHIMNIKSLEKLLGTGIMILRCRKVRKQVSRFNQAHLALIEKALDQYANQGKRILITFGAGHKGWLRRALMKKSNIKLKDLFDVI